MAQQICGQDANQVLEVRVGGDVVVVLRLEVAHHG